MLKKYIEDIFGINNTVMPFSKAYLYKINISCPAEMHPLVIRGGVFCSNTNFIYAIKFVLHFPVTNYLNQSVINLFFNFICSNIVYLSYFHLKEKKLKNLYFVVLYIFIFFKRFYLSLTIVLYIIFISYIYKNNILVEIVSTKREIHIK